MRPDDLRIGRLMRIYDTLLRVTECYKIEFPDGSVMVLITCGTLIHPDQYMVQVYFSNKDGELFPEFPEHVVYIYEDERYG